MPHGHFASKFPLKSSLEGFRTVVKNAICRTKLLSMNFSVISRPRYRHSGTTRRIAGRSRSSIREVIAFGKKLWIAVFLMLVTTGAQATVQTFLVTNAFDTGTGSLRTAINLANANAGSTIQITATGTILLASELPMINVNMSIIKTGAGTIAVSGQNARRVFFVNNGIVSFTNLSIINGSSVGTNGLPGTAGGSTGGGGGGGGGGLGGGLFVNSGGTVTLNNISFSGNKATGGKGGNGASWGGVNSAPGGNGGVTTGTLSTASFSPVLKGGAAQTDGSQDSDGGSADTGYFGNGGGGGGGARSGFTGGAGGNGGYGAGAGGGGSSINTPGAGGLNDTNGIVNSLSDSGAYYGAGGDAGTFDGIHSASAAGGAGGGGSGLGGAVFVAPDGTIIFNDTSIDSSNSVIAGLSGTTPATIYNDITMAQNGAALGGATLLTLDQVLNLGGTSTVTIAASIDSDGADGGIVKMGSGRVILTASNGYVGATDVQEGTLQIGNGVAAGASIAGSVAITVQTTGTLAVNLANGESFGNGIAVDGELRFLSSGTNFIDALITDLDNPGAAVMTQAGSGVTVLTAANTFTGSINIIAGKLQAGNESVISDSSAVTVGALGKLDLYDPVAGGSWDQSIGSLAGAGQVILGSATLTTGGSTSSIFSGVITDGTDESGGSLVKAGKGSALILTGSNTYTGLTTVDGADGDVTLQIGDGISTIASIANSNLAGPIQVINGGNLTVDLANGKTFSNDVQFFESGVLNLIASGTNILTGNLIDDGFGIINQTGSGTTIYTGNGALFKGTANVTAGTLQIGNGNPGANLGAIIVVTSGAKLAVNLADGEIFANNVTMQDSDAVLNAIASGTNYFTGSIDGAGIFNQNGSGTTILQGTCSYTGATNIATGRLQAGRTNAMSANSSVVVLSPGILDIHGYNQNIGSLQGSGKVYLNSATAAGILTTGTDNSSTIFAGTITDGTGVVVTGGSVAKQGLGTWALSGSNTYTGKTTVYAGTLAIVAAGAISGSSLVEVKAGAIVDTAAVSFTMKGSQPFKFTLNGTTGLAGELNAGVLNITTGVVDFEVLGTLTAQAYVIASYNSLTGSQFASVLNLPAGYTINYNYQSFNEIALVVPEPGTWAMVACGLGMLAGTQRLRRRS